MLVVERVTQLLKDGLRVESEPGADDAALRSAWASYVRAGACSPP